jgi:CRP-like cAMP-binding protein
MRIHDPSSAAIYADRLYPFCVRKNFSPGDVIRQNGHYYKDMYLITEGRVDVCLPGQMTIELGPGTPIGEIGFIWECCAVGTVIARTAVSAIVIDDGTLERMRRSDRDWVIDFCNFLTTVAEQRVGSPVF